MGSDAFTGERPGWGKDFDYDEARHLTAYIYAAELAAGKSVLDAGSGEGFGTQTLCARAEKVTGVDYNEQAVAFSRSKWTHPNLEFKHVDLTAPGSFDSVFDVVLNFQVVEHIEDPLPFLKGLAARVAPGGQLMLTTPNRLMSFSENPYHVREYTGAELTELLKPLFSSVEMLGVHGNDKVKAFDRGREAAVKRILRLDPFGIRNMLPQSVINFAFAKLAVLVRRSARNSPEVTAIVPEDFTVQADNVDEALDLVALCRP
jgi:SAM-dependent methyltransferase